MAGFLTSSSLLLLKEKEAVSIGNILPVPLGKGSGERSRKKNFGDG